MTDEITPDMIRAYQQMVQDYPIEYCKNVLGVNLWSRQQEIMKAFADPKVRFISIKSGNGVGKTFMLASLVCQYLDTHCPGYAVVSGASWTGVLKTIWPSLRSLISNAPTRLGGEIHMTEWRRGNMWGAFCVSPDKPENISGMRTRNGALVLVDEASALTQEVHEAVMGLCSAHGSKIVYSGNPLRAEGPFYDTFSDASWLNFQISSEEAANQNIPGLATWEWIEGLKAKWGEDDPRYRARVLGEFPENIFDALVKNTWVKNILVPRVMSQKGTLRLGVDVARYGDDKTVLVVRDDRSVLHVEAHGETSMTEVVGLVKKAVNKFQISPENVFVDDTGCGCFTKNAQIMTPKGFVPVADLKTGDAVYSRKKDGTVCIETVKQNILREPTPILKIGELEFSHCHLLPYRTRKNYEYRIDDWRKALSCKYIELDSVFNWVGEDKGLSIPNQIRPQYNGGFLEVKNGFDVTAEQMALFLGWFLSEGSIDKTGIKITQKKSENFESIRKACSPFGKVQTKQDGFMVFNKNLVEWLQQNCIHNGEGRPCFRLHVPELIKNATVGTINVFLDTFLRGDGYFHKGSRIFYTTSPYLRDDIYELLLKAGKSCDIRVAHTKGSTGLIQGRLLTRTSDCYIVYDHKQYRNVHADKRKYEVQEYEDNVYYLTITGETHLLYGRTNQSRPFWTHNGGVTDMLWEDGMEVTPENFGSSPCDKNTFANKRAELFWAVRDGFRPDSQSAKQYVPKEYQMILDECTKIKFKTSRSGKLLIEGKDEMKRRLGKSPDYADAYALTFGGDVGGFQIS